MLLQRLQLTNLKPSPSPSVLGKNLSIDDGSPLNDPFIYRSTVGMLQYLTTTRLDIAYIVNHLSQFLQRPTDAHWQAVKRVLRYVSATKNFGLFFQPSSDLSISTYSDADWASNIDDRNFVACVFVGSNLVSWSSKKQTVVARSSTESEYRALAHTASEVIWLNQLLSKLGMLSFIKPIIWYDHLSVGAIATNPVFHAKTKHIEIDAHFVRDHVLRGGSSVCSLIQLASRLPYKTPYTLSLLVSSLQTRST
ncbi:secreted RxLR effector protein 161-like [Benincasa hispida]|uniref:secreted RxLR effector protein 161-like n=1 Tax=Benincasa hispida TaxID=102211 RepID=UPI00190048E2|nr:secreted RxLR effector protein 161-like [Benincasa hispida]